MKIAVAGTGYVGLSLAVLLAQHNHVVAVDVVSEKVDKINNKISPIHDEYIEEYLKSKNLDLFATLDGKKAYKDADLVIIATPTDYNAELNYFDTSRVEEVIDLVLSVNQNVTMIIKSTVPVGYTVSVKNKYKYAHIIFSPEFLREGRALYDNLYPSRIIVGVPNDDPELMHNANLFAELLVEGALKKDVSILTMKSTEAEAVKLFANTYLALRVSYFNELDTYAESKGLNTKSIIEGVCLDPRIGAHYNNPSFGYGGYCLPKDTKQLKANYKDVPENLISAIVQSNETRKCFIADDIINLLASKRIKNPTVGIYRLTMKSESDNFRQSAIQSIIGLLQDRNINIVIYEPTLKAQSFMNCRVETDFSKFASSSSLIVANRFEPMLNNVVDKLYTRDIYGRD